MLLVAAAAAVGAFLYFRKAPETTQVEPMAKTEAKAFNEKPIENNLLEPIARKEPEPKKTGPEPLSPELQKVKDATVFVSADKQRTVGSGFFAVEPGLVLTTASVLGMTDANSPPPKKIEVYWGNVGAPKGEGEVRAVAQIVAVDPVNNLAALRVNEPNMPAPLVFEDASKISDAQNVHIAGFPFAQKVRKDFTLTATAIAKVKKDGGGRLAEIHVNEGMNRGNAGGPVVTPLGAVVGVGTGAVRDPQVHYAVATDVVKRFLDPRIGDAVFGKLVVQGGQTKVPTKFPLIDPLGRIKDVRCEVWTGLPGPPRPYSYTPPIPVNGDGPRMPQPLNNKKTFANNDLVMPATIPTGQVVWVQAIITCSDNTMQWSVATTISVPPASPYQLIPANLTLNLTTPKERTVTLNYTLTPDAKKAPITGAANILEVMGPDPAGAQMRTAFGTLNIVTDPDGKNMPAAKQVLDLVRQIPTTFALDKTGLIRKRTDRAFDKDPPAGLKEQVLDQQSQIDTPFEAAMMPMPNKTVQPGENWTTTYYVRARPPKKPVDNLQLTVTATYEGTLKKDDRSEAVITVTGKVTTANPDLKKWEGNVTGKLGFDTSGGYLSSGKLTLSTDGGAGYSLDLDFQRVAGNGMSIQFPQDPKITPPPPPPPPIAKGKTNLLDKKDSLSTKDLVDQAMTAGLPMKKKAHVKDFFVPMQMGKTYTINLTSTAFDAFLKLHGPNNNVVAQDDNGGGGTNSQIVYRATATGQYRISASSKNGNTGAFHITVTEGP